MREAAYHGQLQVVKLLHENGCDIHIKNEHALAFAVSCHTNKGHLEVVKYLLENSADIEISKSNHPFEWRNIRDTGIQEYLNNILLTTKRIIMPTQEELIAMTTAEKKVVLIKASETGDLETINLLIQLNLNIRADNNEALRQAAYHGQLEVIKLLVEHGADIHANNEWALTYAATCHSNNRLVEGVNPKQGNLDVVKYLLEHDANMKLALVSHPDRWKHIMDRIIIAYLNGLGYTF